MTTRPRPRTPLRRFVPDSWLRIHPAWPASPWAPLPEGTVVCNICHWTGDGFDGLGHSESADCPSCGAIARDRFLFLCLQQRVPEQAGLTLLETSPRLGREYRAAMRRWFDYRASDYDNRAHRADLVLDLQDIDLPDDSFDIVLSSHVLEHLPDTDRALDELYRVIKPGGHLILLVPVLQGETAPPTEPEFHGDATEVFWRFGPDLTGRLAERGFDVHILCPADLITSVEVGEAIDDEPAYGEFDSQAIVAALAGRDLTCVVTREQARRHVIRPSYMFLAWDCSVPVGDD